MTISFKVLLEEFIFQRNILELKSSVYVVKRIYFQCKEFISNEPPSNGLLQPIHASSFG